MRGSHTDDPSIVRHIHDLAILKDIAMSSEDFTTMALSSIQSDDSSPRNNPSFAGSSIKDKFSNMFSILENDAEYPKEYERFVKMMSYALYEHQVPDFKSATKAVKELADKVLSTYHTV